MQIRCDRCEVTSGEVTCHCDVCLTELITYWKQQGRIAKTEEYASCVDNKDARIKKLEDKLQKQIGLYNKENLTSAERLDVISELRSLIDLRLNDINLLSDRLRYIRDDNNALNELVKKLRAEIDELGTENARRTSEVLGLRGNCAELGRRLEYESRRSEERFKTIRELEKKLKAAAKPEPKPAPKDRVCIPGDGCVGPCYHKEPHSARPNCDTNNQYNCGTCSFIVADQPKV